MKKIMMLAAALLLAAGKLLGSESALQLKELLPKNSDMTAKTITAISRNSSGEDVYFGDDSGRIYNISTFNYKRLAAPSWSPYPVMKIAHTSNYITDPLLGKIVYLPKVWDGVHPDGVPIAYSPDWQEPTRIDNSVVIFNDIACNKEGLFGVRLWGGSCMIYKYFNNNGKADWTQVFSEKIDIAKLVASDSKLFGISDQGYIYEINVQDGTSKYTNCQAGNINKFTCTSDGVLWCLSSDNTVFYCSQNDYNWKATQYKYPGKDLACEVMYHNGKLWAADIEGNVYSSSSGTSPWERVYNIPNISCMGYNNNGEFFGTSDGKLYSSISYGFSVSLVSGVPNHPDDAIYRVTINGIGLDQDQLFINGYNGFRYRIFVDNLENGPYAKDAYPITGLVYDDNGGTTASLTPRPISFLWRGPRCANIGAHILTIREYVTSDVGGSNPTDCKLSDDDEWTYALPKTEDMSVSGIGSIVFNQNKKTVYPTGVSATEFGIQLKDSNSNPIPLSDPRYNNLVFYAQSDAGTNYEKVVGCDPMDITANDWAIIPAEYVEMKFGAEAYYPRYGVPTGGLDLSGDKSFKRFYLFQGKGCNSSLNIDAVLTTVSGSSTFNVNTNSVTGAVTHNNDYNLNGGSIYNVVLKENGTDQELSNFMSDKYGNHKGYLDYALLKEGEYTGIKKGVYAIFPQGINPLQFADRLNPARMQVGYFLEPNVNEGSGFTGGTACHADVNSDYCLSMQDTKIYYCVFDRYGRHDCGEVRQTGIYTHTWDEGETDGQQNYYRQRILAGNYSKVPICMNVVNTEKANTKDTDDYGDYVKDTTNKDYNNTIKDHNFGMGGEHKGVFFPPGKDEKFGSRVHAVLEQDTGMTYKYNYIFTGRSPFDYRDNSYLFQTTEYMEAQTAMTAWFTFNTVFSAAVPTTCSAYAYLYEGKAASYHVRAYHIGAFYTANPESDGHYEDNTYQYRYYTRVYGCHAGERNGSASGLYWKW